MKAYNSKKKPKHTTRFKFYKFYFTFWKEWWGCCRTSKKRSVKPWNRKDNIIDKYEGCIVPKKLYSKK